MPLWPGKRDSRYWCLTKDGDVEAYAIYRRHYSAAKNPRPQIRQFVGPGESIVLISPAADALFVWRKFISDAGELGINCAVFRNEGPHLASLMILDAMIFAWEKWPGQRLYTYVEPSKVHSPNPGYCFICAGWRRCGRTAKGLRILEQLPFHSRRAGPERASADYNADRHQGGRDEHQAAACPKERGA